MDLHCCRENIAWTKSECAVHYVNFSRDLQSACFSPTARQSLHGQLCVCGNCWKAIHRSSCEFGRSTSSERNTIGQCPEALSSIDSIFAHDFRVAVCAWCIGCGSERSTLSSNITSGPGLYGIRAHRGNAFQSLRRLVARSTQPAHGFKAFASLKIRRRRIARRQFGRFLGVSRRDELVDVCALADCARERVLLFADQALHRCDPLFSWISPSDFSDWCLDRPTRSC